MTKDTEEQLANIRAEHKADVDRAVVDPVFCSKVMTSPEYKNAHSSRAYLLAHIARLEEIVKTTSEELVSMTDSREKLRILLSRCEDQCHRLMDHMDK